MTLEELQAEFPHGSRWTVPGEGPTVWRVVGWDTRYDSVLCRREQPDGHPQLFETRGLLPHAMRALVPCPITAPVRLNRHSWGNDSGGTFWSSTGCENGLYTGQFITLHPDGRYTWEGGPES